MKTISFSFKRDVSSLISFLVLAAALFFSFTIARNLAQGLNPEKTTILWFDYGLIMYIIMGFALIIVTRSPRLFSRIAAVNLIIVVMVALGVIANILFTLPAALQTIFKWYMIVVTLSFFIVVTAAEFMCFFFLDEMRMNNMTIKKLIVKSFTLLAKKFGRWISKVCSKIIDPVYAILWAAILFTVFMAIANIFAYHFSWTIRVWTMYAAGLISYIIGWTTVIKNLNGASTDKTITAMRGLKVCNIIVAGAILTGFFLDFFITFLPPIKMLLGWLPVLISMVVLALGYAIAAVIISFEGDEEDEKIAWNQAPSGSHMIGSEDEI